MFSSCFTSWGRSKTIPIKKLKEQIQAEFVSANINKIKADKLSKEINLKIKIVPQGPYLEDLILAETMRKHSEDKRNLDEVHTHLASELTGAIRDFTELSNKTPQSNLEFNDFLEERAKIIAAKFGTVLSNLKKLNERIDQFAVQPVYQHQSATTPPPAFFKPVVSIPNRPERPQLKERPPFSFPG